MVKSRIKLFKRRKQNQSMIVPLPISIFRGSSFVEKEINEVEKKKDDGRMEEDYFLSLPDEVAIEILSHLKIPELLNLKGVSKTFERWVSMHGVSFEELRFDRCGDENGILYWIGTNRGTSEYINPSTTKRVVVAANHKYSNFVGRTPFWARNVGDCLHTFYEVDFGEDKLVCPNHYTMTYGNDGSGWEPRNWRLMASNDRMNWTVLKDHKDDDSLSGAFSVHHWKLDYASRPKSSFSFLSTLGIQMSDRSERGGKGFRYFRLVQTGKNRSGYHTFFVCGFEIYGKVHYNYRKGEVNPTEGLASNPTENEDDSKNEEDSGFPAITKATPLSGVHRFADEENNQD